MTVSRRDFLKLSGTAAATAGLTVIDYDLEPAKAYAQTLRIKNAKETASICPYCAVGCGQIVHTIDGKVVNIEGDPDHPISLGTLCPKGSATYQLIVNERRLSKVKYKAPNSDKWEEKPLDWAMDRIAQLYKKTRDAAFVEKEDNITINQCRGIASMGSAMITNEEAYLLCKLNRALGVIYLEHQARV